MFSGWRNLTNPVTDPVMLNRCFRFTFCFSNRKRMLLRFKELLQRKAGESLENWNVPYFQIGGAGTHFPRRDKDGSPIYPPNMLSAERALVCEDMGPHQWVGRGAETPRRDAVDTQAMLENIGYGGEWFDSHDVEQYLKMKGIYLDGHSNLIEIDARLVLPQIQKIQSTRSTSNSTSPSVRTPSPTIPAYPEVNVTDQSFDLFQQDTLYPTTHVEPPVDPRYLGSSEKDTLDFQSRIQEPLTSEQVYDGQAWPWIFQTSYPTNLENTLSIPLNGASDTRSASTAGFNTPPAPRVLTLDVEQLVERLVDGAVCLGRAPGFRKEMVENALALSVSDGY
jgi:hypothetical protein